jgi:hypothetical protein
MRRAPLPTVDCRMAVLAKGDEVLFAVLAGVGPVLNVMNFQV